MAARKKKQKVSLTARTVGGSPKSSKPQLAFHDQPYVADAIDKLRDRLAKTEGRRPKRAEVLRRLVHTGLSRLGLLRPGSDDIIFP